MKLQILVPQYNETNMVIKPLLDSISIQQGVDLKEIEVIIVNDGTDIFLTDKFLRSYNFSIKYYKAKHGGVSATRNEALKHATADYIMWCDADDMFGSVVALNIILNEITKGEFDVLVPMFLQEVYNPNGQVLYIEKGRREKGGMDGIFVHGKVYRRKYLLEQHLSWENSLTLNEDSYFNAVALQCTKNIRYCDFPYYIWKFNPNSVTRSTPDWTMKNYPELIRSNECILKQFKDRHMDDAFNIYVGQMLYNIYYTVNNEPWGQPDSYPYLNAVMTKLKEYYLQYGSSLNKISPEIRNKINENQRLLKSQGKDVSISFDDWINKLINWEG